MAKQKQEQAAENRKASKLDSAYAMKKHWNGDITLLPAHDHADRRADKGRHPNLDAYHLDQNKDTGVIRITRVIGEKSHIWQKLQKEAMKAALYATLALGVTNGFVGELYTKAEPYAKTAITAIAEANEPETILPAPKASVKLKGEESKTAFSLAALQNDRGLAAALDKATTNPDIYGQRARDYATNMNVPKALCSGKERNVSVQDVKNAKVTCANGQTAQLVMQ